jgi:hypothetical protein
MKPEQLLTKALNTVRRWDEELEVEDGRSSNLNKATTAILEYGLNNLDYRKTTPVRNAIALAYAILDLEG